LVPRYAHPFVKTCSRFVGISILLKTFFEFFGFGRIDFLFLTSRDLLKSNKNEKAFEQSEHCMCWCVDVLMCLCVDVDVDVLICWCVNELSVDVAMCWCVDDRDDVLMCWYVDVLMCDVWMCWWLCWCVDVLMCWCVDVLTCWCVDVLMCWCVDVLMCWCVETVKYTVEEATYQKIKTWKNKKISILLMCWCVDVLMCWRVDVMIVLVCWCVDVLMCWCVHVVDVLMWMCWYSLSERILYKTNRFSGSPINFDDREIFRFSRILCFRFGFEGERIEEFRKWDRMAFVDRDDETENKIFQNLLFSKNCFKETYLILRDFVLLFCQNNKYTENYVQNNSFE